MTDRAPTLAPGPAAPPGPRRDPAAPRVPAWRLARAFALVGLCAFGGVMPWVYRTVVEKERWLDKAEFSELWSMGLILPGATSTNIAGMLGHRLGGPRGAGAAVAGLLTPPFVIVIAMAILYQRFGDVPAVHGMVRGVTAVAAGLVLATAAKLATGQRRKLGIAVFGGAAFLGMTVLRWPLFAVVGLLIPISLAAHWRLAR
jgi:chromate transporter